MQKQERVTQKSQKDQLLSFLQNSRSLSCPICFLQFTKRIRSPMMICNEQHTICQACLSKLTNKKNRFQCPLCKIRVLKTKVRRNMFLLQIIQKLSQNYGDYDSQCQFQQIQNNQQVIAQNKFEFQRESSILSQIEIQSNRYRQSNVVSQWRHQKSLNSQYNRNQYEQIFIQDIVQNQIANQQQNQQNKNIPLIRQQGIQNSIQDVISSLISSCQKIEYLQHQEKQQIKKSLVEQEHFEFQVSQINLEFNANNLQTNQMLQKTDIQSLF